MGDLGSIPGLGRSPGGGNSYPLQYSGLETSMDYIVLGVARSQTRLSDFDFSLKLPVSGIFLPRSHCLTSSFLGSGLSQHLATPMNNPLMEEMEETVLTSLNPDILRQQLPTACVQRESRMSVFVTMSWSPGGEGPQCLSV